MNKIILFLFFSGILTASAQIERTEPPFWWSDMQKEEIQLMFYGSDIAQYEPTVQNGPKLKEVKRTDNDNYIFVTLDFDGLPAGNYKINFKKSGKTAFSKDYQLKERKINSAKREGFDASDVLYLVMPDRFANGNASNDSHPELTEKVNRSELGGRHGGDIEGIIKNLDYIKDLGATAIWSTPMLEDNDSTYSYHTYAQSDVYRIDPRYGTNEDYKRLANELHKRDMKLVMDYVTNHWGAEHWMIEDLPEYNWIHQFPGYANSNYMMTTQMDPHNSKWDLRYCVDGWFVRSMPDLNQNNPLVLKYLIQNAIWWIEYAGLDGFRVDTYSFNDKEGIAEWTETIMEEYPNFNIVGEVWMHDQAQISYWQKDSPIGAIQDFNSKLPSVMDFTLHDALTVMYNEEKPQWGQGMIRAYENFVNDFLYADIYNLLVFAGNHDTNRINEIYDGDLDKYKLAMTLVFTTRGIPQIYYGDEIGMRGNKEKLGDGDIRRDFPGGWKTDKQSAFTKAGRTAAQDEYHTFTKNLLNYRKSKDVLHFGKMLQFIPENNVYVYFRYNDAETVMVVINNNPEDQMLDLGRFAEGIKNYTTGKEIIFGNQISLDDSLQVEGKKSMVIELGN